MHRSSKYIIALRHRQGSRSASCIAAALLSIPLKDSSADRRAKRLHEPTLSNRVFAIFFVVTILIAITLLLAPKTQAQSSWTGPSGTTTSPTTGNWNTSTNWSPAGVPGSGTALTFGGSGSSTYTSTNNISGTFTLSTVSLNSTSTATDIIAGNAFTVSGSSISMANTGAFTIQNNLAGANGAVTLTLTGNGSGLATLSGNFSEQNTSNKQLSLTKTGTSTFVLSGTNAFSGATSINAGILRYQSSGAFGNDGGTLSAITVASGATAQLQGGITSSANSMTISGTGATNGTGALENVSGTNNYAGLITLGAAATISSDAGTLNLTNTGNITGSGFTLTVTGAGDGSISSNINTGAGGLTKNGNGTWTVSGASTYTGATNINGGTLSLDSAGSTTARLANTSTINVNSGGTLLLANSSGTTSTDRIGNSVPVTVGGGGTINTGGLSEGTRPTNSGASNGAAGMGALTLSSTSSGSHATFDFLTGANGSSLVFSSLSGGSGAFVDIKNWTGTAGSDNSAAGNDRLLFATNPSLSNAQLANFQFYNDSGIAFAVGATIIVYGNEFELVPVPEPSTWAAAVLALGAIGFSQRRRLRDAIHRLVIG
jgi:autotransporter-associated beta strand protein